jgi:hypothetical protein
VKGIATDISDVTDVFITSFLNTLSSAPPSTSQRLLHRKLLIPSSFTFAGPVRTTVFLEPTLTLAGARAEVGLMIGKLAAYVVELNWDLLAPEGAGER